jgi:putative hemolysin
MSTERNGRYRARIARTEADIAAARGLRWRCFIDGRGASTAGRESGQDVDPHDAICSHVLVEEARTGTLVGCFRMLHLGDGGDIARSYAAQYYELSNLTAFDGPMVEMGRFCIDPDRRDPDILRVAWAAMTRYVDAHGVEMLFQTRSASSEGVKTSVSTVAMPRPKTTAVASCFHHSAVGCRPCSRRRRNRARGRTSSAPGPPWW